MKRIGSSKGGLAASTPAASLDPKKKEPTNWAQKRASKLIMAPQPRLTEFKAVYAHEGMAEQSTEDTHRIERKQISSSSLSDLVPLIIQRHLSLKEVAVTPYVATIQASCLFLDISRFTTISEALANDWGHRGPEILARCVNKLFTQLVRLVQRAGGDIFKFAGDAVIVLWPVEPDSEETLQVVAHRAVQCADDVQKTVPELKLDELKTEANKKMDISLAFKCGVGVGKVSIVHLGGGKLEFGAFASEDEEGRMSTKRVLDPRTQSSKSTGEAIAGRREYIALGDPLKQAFAAEKLAERGDIVVSRQTWSLIQDKFKQKKPKSGKPLPDGFVLIGELIQGIKKKRQDEIALPQKEWMLTYVPRSAHLFLEVEAHTRKDWVSELRRVTVLFINLGVPKDELNKMLTTHQHDMMSKLHEYFGAVQTAVMDYEGSINKFLMDDKGSTIIAVFGLPPISHENDATRGVLAALAISTFLQSMGAEPAVGVSTGIAFCGVVGHPGGRREYTVLGDVVNLSARLMQRAAEKQEGIVTDKETYYQAQEHLEFNYLKQIQVKGKTKKVDVYQPHQKGFKTKRTYLGKVLGVRKHRRRPSLDADWRGQVENFNKMGGAGMSEAEIEGLKKMLLDARANQALNSPPVQQQRSSRTTAEDRPRLSLAARRDLMPPQDDDKLTSDQFEEIIAIMAKMHGACTSELPQSMILEGSIGLGKSRMLARLSSVLKTEPNTWILEAACNPFERGTLARPFGLFTTLISSALWLAHEESKSKSGQSVQLTEKSSLDDVPVPFRRHAILRWLTSSQTWNSEANTKYLLNEDFGIDFEEPFEESERRKKSTADVGVDMERNFMLITQKAQLLSALFEGMCHDRRVICLIDDALHLDSSSWSVAVFLVEHGKQFPKGLSVVLASRPISDFVLIDANSRKSYLECQKIAGVLKFTVPVLPPRFVRQLAIEVIAKSKGLQRVAIGVDIEIALEKAQGNPLFVRELVQSMIDSPGVLDIDVKNLVAVFGVKSRMQLKNVDDFPNCSSCDKRFAKSNAKQHCRVCGRVVCADCCPTENKRSAVGYKEIVRCCVDCVRDPVRNRAVTVEAIENMNLEPPVAVVCVIGTWIDKLSTRQQMVLKVACLLRQETRFEKSKAYEAYPLDRAIASFELEFDALIRMGFVRAVYDEDRDGPQGLFSAVDEDLYEFCHSFLPDVLNQRVLESQRDELKIHVNDARLKRELQQREEFMSNKGTNLGKTMLKEGYVFVHKTNMSSNRRPWKQRWAVIVGHRMEFYYERNGANVTEAINLQNAKTNVEKSALSGKKRVIRIQVTEYEKHGKLFKENRDLFISPELSTDQELNQWMYFLNMGVEADGFKVRTKRGTSVTGWLRNKTSRPGLLTNQNSTTLHEEPVNGPGYVTSAVSPSNFPRKSRGLEILSNFASAAKKKSSSLMESDASLPPPPPSPQSSPRPSVNDA